MFKSRKEVMLGLSKLSRNLCRPTSYRYFSSNPLNFPKLIHGSSTLGNLFQEIDYKTKVDIVQCMLETSPDGRIVIDTAGKYGAGLALETIGQALKELKVDPENVLISNKLGWARIPLTTPEPTFEPGYVIRS